MSPGHIFSCWSGNLDRGAGDLCSTCPHPRYVSVLAWSIHGSIDTPALEVQKKSPLVRSTADPLNVFLIFKTSFPKHFTIGPVVKVTSQQDCQNFSRFSPPPCRKSLWTPFPRLIKIHCFSWVGVVGCMN